MGLHPVDLMLNFKLWRLCLQISLFRVLLIVSPVEFALKDVRVQKLAKQSLLDLMMCCPLPHLTLRSSLLARL